MLHVNANHSAVVSDFPTSIKPAQSGRNTLAFYKRGDSTKRSKGEDAGGDMQPNLGVPFNKRCVCGKVNKGPSVEVMIRPLRSDMLSR